MAGKASLKRVSVASLAVTGYIYISIFLPSFFSSALSGWCTPVFVFCQEEASAASLSARLFLKDMRSYPAQPFPFPANPNKAGMPRERTETEGALFLTCAADCWKFTTKKKKKCLRYSIGDM